MKNALIKFAIIFKILKITKQSISSWTISRNIELLEFALKNANYKERILVIQSFQKLSFTVIIPKLIDIAKTDYNSVAQQAMKTIEILDIEKKFYNETKILKEYIESKNEPNNLEVLKKEIIWPDRETRMPRLRKLKEQLKKPSR